MGHAFSVPIGCNAIGNSSHTAAAEMMCLIKSLINTKYHWFKKVSDIVQLAFEYRGYIQTGKAVGLIGNIIAGCIVGGTTGPIGAIVGGVNGAAIWGTGELVIWLLSYYGDATASIGLRLVENIIAGFIIGRKTGIGAILGAVGGAAISGAIELAGCLFSHYGYAQFSEGIKLIGKIISGVFIGGIDGPEEAVVGGVIGAANWGLAIWER